MCLLKGQSRALPSPHPGTCKSFDAYKYRGNNLTYKYRGSVQQPNNAWLVQFHGHGNQGNIVPRMRIDHTSLECHASVVRLHHVGFPDVTTVCTPTCLSGTLPQRSVQTATLVRDKYTLLRNPFYSARYRYQNLLIRNG